MATRSRAVVCALTLAAGVLIACANGGESADPGGEGGEDDVSASGSGGGSGGGSGSGSGGSSGTASGSGGGSGSSSGSGVHDSGASHTDSGSSGDGSAKEGGSKEGGASGDDGGPAEDGGVCSVAPDECALDATSLGSVAGDQSGNPVGASGYTSEWLRLDETEGDSGLFAAAMNFTATLTSPPGMNYDLYVYLGNTGGTGNLQCTSVTGQSTNPAGEQDEVTFKWGETGTFSNGSDDSATVMIEVRWVSGACSTAQNWSLSAHGD